jgi:hypothetical protein
MIAVIASKMKKEKSRTVLMRVSMLIDLSRPWRMKLTSSRVPRGIEEPLRSNKLAGDRETDLWSRAAWNQDGITMMRRVRLP